MFLASLARGYSGFGFTAVLVSSWALVAEPARAVALFLAADGDNPARIRAAVIAYFFLLDLMGLGIGRFAFSAGQLRAGGFKVLPSNDRFRPKAAIRADQLVFGFD